MNKVQNNKKKEVAKKIEDSSCTSSSSDTSSSDCSPHCTTTHGDCRVEPLPKQKIHCRKKCVTKCHYEYRQVCPVQYVWSKDTECKENWKDCKPEHNDHIPEKCHDKPHKK